MPLHMLNPGARVQAQTGALEFANAGCAGETDHTTNVHQQQVARLSRRYFLAPGQAALLAHFVFGEVAA